MSQVVLPRYTLVCTSNVDATGARCKFIFAFYANLYNTNARARVPDRLIPCLKESSLPSQRPLVLKQIFYMGVMVLALYPEKHTCPTPVSPFIQKPMGMLINALAPDCSVKEAVAPATAIHVKKDYTPAKSRFVTLTKDEVESTRRKAYAYAF